MLGIRGHHRGLCGCYILLPYGSPDRLGPKSAGSAPADEIEPVKLLDLQADTPADDISECEKTLHHSHAPQPTYGQEDEPPHDHARRISNLDGRRQGIARLTVPLMAVDIWEILPEDLWLGGEKPMSVESNQIRQACWYPQSHATARPIRDELTAVVRNRERCSSIYLDTIEGMSNNFPYTEGENHHQGLARSHKLTDGSVYFFLSHSNVGEGGHGNLSSYRFGGRTDAEHVLTARPLTVAPMQQLEPLNEQHPSDLVFLPDVNNLDAGYIFLTEEYDQHMVICYRWDPRRRLVLLGTVAQRFPAGGPNFLFLDRVNDTFYLGIASGNWGWGELLSAREEDLFPECAQGSLNLAAFRSQSNFSFPVREASQVKLIRDREGVWYLLGFRSDPDSDPNGTDYVDLYGVTFQPFAITALLRSTHVFFPPGDTGFASTGTHYVEQSGRLLLSSSYRWAKDEGPGSSSYVSRVDECPSA